MLFAVIPAGGSGTRLWPLSRAGNPKFLHPLTGTATTLIQATVDRLAPVADAGHTFVVTGVAHAAAVARQLPALPADNILVEPSPRDSCAAIGLAAAVIARRDPQAVMGSFAADHLVADQNRFLDAVRAAEAGARDGLLMTIGITPTRPETGYGYLQCGAQIGDGPVLRVEEFKEKPPHDVAVAYVESGRYFWNASMFVWRVDRFLSELLRQQPELHAGVVRIAAAWDTPDREAVLGEIWPHLPKISVDYAVMEGAAAAGVVGTVPGDFGWNDVGDFHTLGDILDRDAHGNVVIGATDGSAQAPTGGKDGVLLYDSERTVVVNQTGRLIATLGMHDVIVVDTPDVLLVCPRDRAQDVKKVVDAVRDGGETHLI